MDFSVSLPQPPRSGGLAVRWWARLCVSWALSAGVLGECWHAGGMAELRLLPAHGSHWKGADCESVLCNTGSVKSRFIAVVGFFSPDIGRECKRKGRCWTRFKPRSTFVLGCRLIPQSRDAGTCLTCISFDPEAVG